VPHARAAAGRPSRVVTCVRASRAGARQTTNEHIKTLHLVGVVKYVLELP
jgi:hypothetical protein